MTGTSEQRNGQDDAPLSFSKASRLPELNIDGQSPHPSTLWRWCLAGVKVKDGLVKLEFQRIGRRMVTTRKAVKRFIAQMSGDTRSDTRAAGRKQLEAAERKLKAAGFDENRRARKSRKCA